MADLQHFANLLHILYNYVLVSVQEMSEVVRKRGTPCRILGTYLFYLLGVGADRWVKVISLCAEKKIDQIYAFRNKNLLIFSQK